MEDARVNAVRNVNKSFQMLVFLTVEGRENEKLKENLRRRATVHTRYNHKNARDLNTLISLGPGSFEVEKVKVALFPLAGREDLSELKQEFGDNYSEKMTAELRRVLSVHKRTRIYNYTFYGVFEFEGEGLSRFPEFVSMLLTPKVSNVLVITDDKLYYLYTKVLDREKFEDFLIVERMVHLQPFEYTEQMVKYVFLPTADSFNGSILFITFSSPLLKLNGFKAKYRRATELKGGNDATSKRGKPFVSFHDNAINDILASLRYNVEDVPGDVEKLFKIIAIISHPKIFPMLSSYVDYSGMYGASQLIRGYTRDDYARIEDIESKVDLMLRGHLNRAYKMSSREASRLISYYATSGLHKKVSRFWNEIVRRDRSRWSGVLKDPNVAGLLFALLNANTERRKITDNPDDPVVDEFFS